MAYEKSFRTPADAPPEPRMAELLEEALTAPGHMGDTYNRFYNYSFGNQLWLRQQGAREPLASFNGWKQLGRHVVKGGSAYYILRPITVKSKTELDEQGQPKTYTKFKPVKGAFPYSMTDGEELPEVEPRYWSRTRALGALGINTVDFANIDGNVQGYSYDRNVAINPMAVEPIPTLFHEMSHIVGDHTTTEALGNYAIRAHRGVMEFEAESSAYLIGNELEIPFNKAESRGYIQQWLRGDTPPDSSIRKVFKIVDRILAAGYEQAEDASAA